jgi:hypothetical protein
MQAVRAGVAIGFERVIEVVKVDATGRDVVECRRDVPRLADLDKLFVRLAIPGERFLEPTLPEKQVAQVEVQARDSESITMSDENATGFLGCRKCPIVAAKV